MTFRGDIYLFVCVCAYLSTSICVCVCLCGLCQCPCPRLNVNVKSENGPNSGTSSDCEWWPPIAAIRHCGPTSTSSSMWSIATTSRHYGTCPSTAPFSSRRMSPSVLLSLRLKPGQCYHRLVHH